ncbi:hypothetical protein V6N11_067766 [Hibiscus sabdariffa]|uniref:RNase H type-1 domain-containing protein n=1 Tax=Hibiscus sabdariffa TaxID=183260 RepID=A0ABR2SS43_9ROSI
MSPRKEKDRIGGLICNVEGEWIVGFVKSISFSNSLQAELWATFEGMKLAWEFGFERLLIENDCRQAVDLVDSVSADSPVLSLVRVINRLRQKYWLTDVSWVPWDRNRLTNALTKLVDPCGFSLCVYNVPPLEVVSLLNMDKACL